jgi:hypothetical protein
VLVEVGGHVPLVVGSGGHLLLGKLHTASADAIPDAGRRGASAKSALIRSTFLS